VPNAEKDKERQSGTILDRGLGGKKEEVTGFDPVTNVLIAFEVAKLIGLSASSLLTSLHANVSCCLEIELQLLSNILESTQIYSRNKKSQAI